MLLLIVTYTLNLVSTSFQEPTHICKIGVLTGCIVILYNKVLVLISTVFNRMAKTSLGRPSNLNFVGNWIIRRFFSRHDTLITVTANVLSFWLPTLVHAEFEAYYISRPFS